MDERVMNIAANVSFMRFLLLNLVVVVAYVAWNLLRSTERAREKRRGYWLRALAMLLVPGAGALYVLFGWLLGRFVFRRPVNLVDVVFSKEREDLLTHAEEDKERNLVPIQDAILISDIDSRRGLFMDVIKYEPKKALYSIALALNSDDSELAHYAASILQSELGKASTMVREGVERLVAFEERLEDKEVGDKTLVTPAGARFRDELAGIDEYGESDAEQAKGDEQRTYYADISPLLEESDDYVRHDALALLQGQLAQTGEQEEKLSLVEELQREMEAAHGLIAEIDLVLSQRLLSELESASFVDSLQTIACIVERRDVLAPLEIAQCVRYNLEDGRMEEAEAWSDQCLLYYPHELASYAARVKLRFYRGDHDGFFEALEALKASGLPLDQEMLELIRFYA